MSDVIKSAWIGFVAVVAAAAISVGGALGAAQIGANATRDAADMTSQGTSSSVSQQRVDCTDEITQALEIYRLHPEIKEKHSDTDPAEVACHLNVRLDQVRAIDAPP